MYILLHFSFKDILCHITCTKKDTIHFLQKNGVLKSTVNCPGALVGGKRQGNCSKPMSLKETKDSKDLYVWHCRKVHTIFKDTRTFTVKDIKLSIRHESWLMDTKLPLELVVELIYLWSQGFTHSEIIHELKLSNKTVTEWCHFFQEACICAVMDNSQPIEGNSIEVEINKSKFGKRKYH